MKRIICSIYIATFIFAMLFFAATVFDYRYMAWESVISLNKKIIHLIAFSLISLILISVSFSGFSKINKKNFYKYLLLILSVVYILINIILYPYMRIFTGTKLMILFVVIAFIPITVISFLLLYKEFKNIFKKKENKTIDKNKSV